MPVRKKDWQQKKALAVMEYITTDTTTRELESKYNVSRNSISNAYKTELKDNKNDYEAIISIGRKNLLNYMNIQSDNSDKLKINNIYDYDKLVDIALKTGRLLNLIENWTEEKQDKNTPNIINIQVNNYKDTE